MLALLLAAAPVDAALLDGLPMAEAVLTAHGKTQSCAGPKLADVVVKLGAPAGDTVRGKALATTIIARARDGYVVVFSLGELDAELGASKAIVATRCDGKPLDAEAGPFRIVVPGELRAARSVRQLESLEISPAP
jgi:hypothetical protein